MHRWRFLLVLVIGLLGFAPGLAAAQAVDDGEDSFLLRVNGDAVVAPTEIVDVVVVISGDVVVDGAITEALLVIDGTGAINGPVDGDIVVINGELILGPAAVVENVTLIDSELVQDPGAVITGTLEEEAEWTIDAGFGWAGAVFSFLAWVGFTIVVLLAGLAFALLAARQLVDSSVTLTAEVGPTLLTALIIWVALPILAVLVVFTLIGIPLTIAIFLFLLPALWFLGYLVAGARLGLAILRTPNPLANRGRLALAALLGLLVFQVIGLVPFLGGLIVFVAGLIGAGALVYMAFRNRRVIEPPVQPAV